MIDAKTILHGVSGARYTMVQTDQFNIPFSYRKYKRDNWNSGICTVFIEMPEAGPVLISGWNKQAEESGSGWEYTAIEG